MEVHVHVCWLTAATGKNIERDRQTETETERRTHTHTHKTNKQTKKNDCLSNNDSPKLSTLIIKNFEKIILITFTALNTT